MHKGNWYRCGMIVLLVSLLVGMGGSVRAQAATACSVTYTVTNSWPGGFQGDVAISNTGTVALTAWNLTWSFGGNQQITNYWNSVVTQSGANVSARNAAWNGSIPVGGTARFGFQGSFSGSNPVPTSFTLNGTACNTPGSTPTPQPPTSTPVVPTPTRTATPVVPTPTPSGPFGSIQAETCTIVQGVVEANQAGFTGSGFVNYNNLTGSYVQCVVSASTAGNVRLDFRYANGTTINQPLEIRVNGSVVNANLAFTGTGAWTAWATVGLTVALNAGSNTIRATATTANGGPNLDRLDIGVADTQPPSTPTNPRTSNLTCTTVTFAWNASTDNIGVVAYDVFHDGQFMTSVDGSTLSTSLTVVPNATWDLYVQARDAAGNVSQGSTPITITVPPCAEDTTPPTAPTNLTASTSGTTVNLSWGASTDAVGVVAYDVFRILNGSTTQAGSVAGRPPATSFTDSGLAASTTYQYYVVARDARPNLSPRSNQISVTTAAACSQPVCGAIQVATDTDVPWGLTTLPDGSVLYARRDADDIIRLVPSSGQQTNTGTVPNVSGTGGEGGLMGLEINPVSFASDRWVYIMHTSPSDNRVVRMRLTTSNTLDQSSLQVLLSGIARNTYHDGGRLRFSPDGQYLFISTGDAQSANAAQDVNTLIGKILRIRPDGSIPTDNPFGNAVWSYGHRNPQGLAFDSQGQLWEQEFGNTVMDETNLIVRGGNYGWPTCEGTTGSCTNPNFIAPKQTYPTSAGSCSGITVVRNALYVACLRGERLYRLVINGSNLTNQTTHFQGTYGRLRTVEPAPDGGLWLTTSNGDRDSTPNNSTTRILHVDLGQ